MVAHPRDFVQPELQSVEGCVRVETQGEDVLEAMYVCAAELFNRIDTTETMQYSVQGCCIGGLRVDENTHNGNYIVKAHLGGVTEILICGLVEDMGAMGVRDHASGRLIDRDEPIVQRVDVETSREHAPVPVSLQGLLKFSMHPRLWILEISGRTSALAVEWDGGVGSNVLRDPPFFRSADGGDGCEEGGGVRSFSLKTVETGILRKLKRTCIFSESGFDLHNLIK